MAMEIKTYAVLQRLNLPRDGQPNAKIIAIKLTRQAAEKLRDLNPGTWVEKHVATKS